MSDNVPNRARGFTVTSSIDAFPTSRELVLVLEELGWQQSSEIPDLLSSWIQDQDEVVVPLDPTRGDFRSLLIRALDTIETRHGLAASQVLRRVIQTARQTFDASRFLRETPTRGGIISWVDGRSLYDAAEQRANSGGRSIRVDKLGE